MCYLYLAVQTPVFPLFTNRCTYSQNVYKYHLVIYGVCTLTTDLPKINQVKINPLSRY